MQRHNLLTDALPLTLEVGGEAFAINTDFRAGIQFDAVIHAKGMDDGARIFKALALLYGEEGIPRDIVPAYEAMLWFIRCGEESKSDAKQRQGTGPPVEAKRMIDYALDGKYIYAAFLDQYGIDLTEIAHLHWWKFRALFTGLRDDHEITRIMGYRAVNTAKIKNKEQRAKYNQLKELYRIPEDLPLEDLTKKVGAMFGGMA